MIGMMLLVAISSFAVENTTSTLLQFLNTEHSPVFPLLPGSLPITDNFRPSTAAYAGTVAQLQGTAYVYHKDGTTAYKLKKDLPIFSGDTLVTAEKSSVTLQMTDATALTLAAQTKLIIEKSLPIMKGRDTVLQLFFGRLRAQVKKLAGEYIIRTMTATLSVQESDFAVAVAPAPKKRGQKERVSSGLLTAVLTGGDQSTVEMAGFFGPSMTVKPLSVAGIRTGNRAEQALYVGPTALPLLRKIGLHPEAQLLLPKNVLSKNTLPKNLLPKNFLPKNFPEKPLQTLPREPIAATDPCWNLFIKTPGTEKKQSFKVCGPEAKTPVTPSFKPSVKLPVNLWPRQQ